MLDSADLVFDNNGLVLLDDVPSCRHKDTRFELLVRLAARLEGQMGDCSFPLAQHVFGDKSKLGNRQEFPNGVDFASGLPPRTAFSDDVISTEPV